MWRISCLDNTLKISRKCAKELFESNVKNHDGTWEEIDEVIDEDGFLIFNEDHMEHMDFLGNENFQKIIAKNKCYGRITFGSLDGDDFGQFWGYEFDGKGNFFPIKAELTWRKIVV